MHHRRRSGSDCNRDCDRGSDSDRDSCLTYPPDSDCNRDCVPTCSPDSDCYRDSGPTCPSNPNSNSCTRAWFNILGAGPYGSGFHCNPGNRDPAEAQGYRLIDCAALIKLDTKLSSLVN
jgi:hypothetical protein